VLIRVSRNAVPAHLRHGDVYPTAGKCPKTLAAAHKKGKHHAKHNGASSKSKGKSGNKGSEHGNGGGHGKGKGK
jgi:hypothetical protein